VVDFGLPETPHGTAVYPVANQQDIESEVLINERPDPLRMHHVGNRGYHASGMPISAQVFGHKGIKIVEADLTSELEGPVDLLRNDATNDDLLQDSAFVIPIQTLMPGTKYTLQMHLTDKAGLDLHIQQSFVTSTNTDENGSLATFWPHSDRVSVAVATAGIAASDQMTLLVTGFMPGPAQPGNKTGRAVRQSFSIGGSPWFETRINWVPQRWTLRDRVGRTLSSGIFGQAPNVISGNPEMAGDVSDVPGYIKSPASASFDAGPRG
jgi:hypothetical protein